MITNISAPIFGQLAYALSSDFAITAEASEAIKAEISLDPTGRSYAGKSTREVYGLLHSPYSQLVGESWAAKTAVAGVELKNWIAPLKLALRLSTASVEVKTAWLGIMGDFQGVSDSYSFDPATSEQWQGLAFQLPGLVDAGKARIITDAHLRALTHTYREAYVEMAVPRVEALIGAGIALTLAEVEELI